MSESERIKAAIDLAVRYGGIDGDHHKRWVIDQMVRVLAGDDYGRIVAEAKDGEEAGYLRLGRRHTAVTALPAGRPVIATVPRPAGAGGGANHREGNVKLEKDNPEAARQTGQPWPIAEAATFLHTSVRTLTNSGKRGTLRLLRIGNRLYVSDEEVRRVATEGLRTSA